MTEATIIQVDCMCYAPEENTFNGRIYLQEKKACKWQEDKEMAKSNKS